MAGEDFSQEIQRLDKEWDSNPSPIVCAHLSDLLRQSGRLDEALDMANTGLKRWQKNISISITLGKCYRDSGLLDKALDIFGFVHKAQPQNLVALLNLAEIYFQKRQWNKTIQFVEDYLFEHPGDETARELLENAKSKKGSPLEEIFSEDTGEVEIGEGVFPETDRMTRVLESQENTGLEVADDNAVVKEVEVQEDPQPVEGNGNSSAPGSLLEYFSEDEMDELQLNPYDRGSE